MSTMKKNRLPQGAYSVRKALTELADAQRLRFCDWQDFRHEIPTDAGVYAIWKRSRLIYAGIAGTGKKHRGLRERLKQHCDGKRGSDKLSVQVFDRFVLPLLSKAQIRSAVAGQLSLDDLTAEFVQTELTFTYLQCKIELAQQIEESIQRGDWPHSKPLLNPIKSTE